MDCLQFQNYIGNMECYFNRNTRVPADMLPSGYNDYVELIQAYMMEDRHMNILAQFQFENRRRETVHKLRDISEYCFKLIDESVSETQNDEEEQDERDDELRKRIQQYNQIMKPSRERQGKERRRRNDNDRDRGRRRKVRTTITQTKLQEMNRIFTLYTEYRQKHKDQNEEDDYLKPEQERYEFSSLKAIGEKLGLGYSTILHKYREFRATKKVKGGALIAAMHHKRKYKKSRDIEQLILRSLKEKRFYTAVQLSKYIQEKYKIPLSRSIISRHLGEMGYSYKNIKAKPPNKNSSQLKELRKLFSEHLIFRRERRGAEILFLDEFYFNANQLFKKDRIGANDSEESKEIYFLILANHTGVLKLLIKNEPINEMDFQNFLKEVEEMLKGREKQQLILLDIDNKIHYNSRIALLRESLGNNNIRLYYLPPYSNQISMLESLFAKIKAILANKEYESLQILRIQLDGIFQILGSPSNSQMVLTSMQESDEYIERSCVEADF